MVALYMTTCGPKQRVSHYTHGVSSVLRKFGNVDKHGFHVAALLLLFLFCSMEDHNITQFPSAEIRKYPKQMRELQVIVIVLSLSVHHISNEANDTKT